ncbi:FAD-dependent oxidoreductase [Aeromicrobium sp.]|uniref:NAD(P)/FAD-dependent oxidoreductase n=1 Tax=Aeromicrobium sp. TaxID=1871063 RepID=UPI0030BDDC9A
MSTGDQKRRVAVIGSGVSGLTAAYVLRKDWDVTVFEADDRIGGHAHTHTVEDRDTTHRVDSGFIVHNDRTYPLLRRLFNELDVEVFPTEMSMSIHCDGCGLEYAGGRGGQGVFAQRRRVADPRYLLMLLGVKKFGRLAHALLDSAPDEPGAEPLTYGDFLRIHGFSDYFISHYAIPVVSCVWSSGHEEALAYPARYLFEFLNHHGFLSIKGSPQWFTVAGGSGTYIDKVTAAVGDVRASSPIRTITRKPDGVELIDAAGELHRADAVVIATHADDALTLLSDPSDDERRVLGAFTYSHNETLLHRDPSQLPKAPAAQSAWNYRMDDCAQRSDRTAVTYWMNKLQGIQSTEPFLVTLNASDRIDPAKVVARMDYTHPIYTPASVAAQGELKGLFTAQTVFAGAYHGWGFHEDGCRSGVDAAAALGSPW